MANTKQQIKRIKTDAAKRARNRAVRSEVRTAVRGARAAIAIGEADAARLIAGHACRLLDKAVSKGVIHANQAANKKSALMRAVQRLEA